MKKIILLSTLVASLLFTSCENLEEINKDPNRAEEVPTYTLLKGQILSTEFRNWYTAFLWGGTLSQQTARTMYTDPDAYILNLGDGSGNFSNLYFDLVNLHILKIKAENEKNQSILGAAQILEAFQVKLATDMYGDIPYSEACNYDLTTGKLLISKPKYDTQESIYIALIKLLKYANTNLAEGAAKKTPDELGAGDYLFNGDNVKWQKFGNSILIRLYMQMSKVKPTEAAAGIAEILSNPTKFPIISSNDDNVTFKYVEDAVELNWNPLYVVEAGSRANDNGTSKTFIDYLSQMNDPRLPVLATPNSENKFVGYPNGEAASDLSVSDFGPKFGKDVNGKNKSRANIWMSYAEVQLLLAEAKQKGLIATGDAKTYYENAVTANFEEYGIGSKANSYLANEGNFTTATNQLQLIYRELWVSTYLKGNQGWDLIRRVGSLGGLVKEVSRSVYPGKGIPTRLSYPQNEKTLNFDNWNEAVTRQGLSMDNNLLYGKMWWQN